MKIIAIQNDNNGDKEVNGMLQKQVALKHPLWGLSFKENNSILDWCGDEKLVYKDEYEHMSYVGEKRRQLKVIMWQNVGYEESDAGHGSLLEY